MRYRCPVCFFDKLPYPPADYHICPSCGTEFGNDDAELSHEQLREMWVAGGANWFFAKAPEHWNPWIQLLRVSSGFARYVPWSSFDLRVQGIQTFDGGLLQNFTADPAVRLAA